MPNTAVKPLYAESTRLETVREDRELPVRKIPHLMDAEFFLCQQSAVNGQRAMEETRQGQVSLKGNAACGLLTHHHCAGATVPSCGIRDLAIR